MLIRELLAIGSGKLKNSLEAEILLSFVLGMSKEEMIARDDIEVSTDASIKLFLKYVDEVSSGKPVAYILKSKEFYGLDFYVDERVLVPRPETEMIVDLVLEYLNEENFASGKYSSNVDEETGSIDFGMDFKMLDVGTGSGNIPCAVLHNFDNVMAEAVDISPDALEVAVKNREYHLLEDRIQIYESDLLENVEDEFFDVITANLPYVGTVTSNFVEEGVKKFEPAVALFAGEDGFDLHRRLFKELREKEMDFNLLIGEFGDGQIEIVKKELAENFPAEKFETEVKNDLAGIPRVYIVRKRR